jgi:predicted N-acetyltransferase YhbS
MLQIRRITPSDYRTVGELQRDCFGSSEMPSERYVENLCSTDPEGCFLGLVEGAPVGYVCSHTFGSIGYLGPLGVRKEYRGNDYGKALVRAAVEYLSRQGATIGLSTWATRGDLIGFYHRLGFRSTLPCREVARPEGAAPTPAPLPTQIRWGSEIPITDHDALVEQIGRWTGAILPGADFSRDLRLFLSRYPDNIVFYLDQGSPRGFLAFHTDFLGEEWGAVAPDDGDAAVLQALIAAREQFPGQPSGWIQFHTHCDRLTEIFLACGYRVTQDLTCMLLPSRTPAFTQPISGLLIRPWWS